jgi:hypothetical protein
MRKVLRKFGPIPKQGGQHPGYQPLAPRRELLGMALLPKTSKGTLLSENQSNSGECRIDRASESGEHKTPIRREVR